MGVVLVLIIIFGVGGIGFIVFIIKSVLAPKQISHLTDMIRQGKTAAATRIAKNLISKDPRNADAHYFLGLAYEQEGKPELALMEYKTVNTIGNFNGACNEVEFRKKIASLFSRFNQQEEALKEFILLSKLEPFESDNFYQIGMLFENRNRSDKAQLFYRKAIEIEPRHSEAHFKLGFLLYRSKRPVESKQALETALKFRKDNFKAFYYLGKLLKDGHDYVGALSAFEKSQKDPEFKIKSLVERGSCYMNMGSFERAITELERAVKLVQDESSGETLYARYFLAVCYERIRNIDKAIEQWEKIYSKKPAFRDVAEKLSQYQDLRADDRIKDYITSNQETFFAICKAVIEVMGLVDRDTSTVANGCQIIAMEAESGQWRNTRKMPKLIRFLRVPEMIEEATIRAFHEDMKKMQVTKGILITSSNFSRVAIDFAQQRPIELYNKDKLQELLNKITLDD